ncbi:MAG: PIN domain-containing protein [Planctomycetota bacterium]
MTEHISKRLPDAVYLDTNVLRSAGPSLNQPWISELLSFTKEYGIDLCVSKLVLKEWCEHIIEILENSRQKLFSSISLLKDYNIQVPKIEPINVNLPEKSRLIETVTRKLENAGFSIVDDWDAPLSNLLNEAVEKRPPFEQGGKGFCDTVILESYAKHAKDKFDKPEVLVISNDSAVERSADRFTKCGITVDFLSGSDVIAKLKSLLDSEVATHIKEKESQLKEYILTHESIILNFVKKTPLKITDWMLNEFLKDDIRGRVEKILSIRPTKISQVVGGVPSYGEKTPSGRYPVLIFVEIEMDIVSSEYLHNLIKPKAIVQPNMIDKNSPVTLGSTNWQPREIINTIKRSVTVYATLDAMKEKQNIFNDFKIEKII